MSTASADPSYVALSGGVGGAKLALGLSKVLKPEQLTVIVNTGDDFSHLGLHVSPDIDTVLYTLSGRNNLETGWGRSGESWNFMEALEELGGETWFRLGDKDLALHVERTRRIDEGETLTELTRELAKRLGVQHTILPMTDAPLRTHVDTPKGRLPFQHYFVRDRCRPEVTGFHFDGADDAAPTAAVLEALAAPSLRGIILCPSNPFVSIAPILAVPGLKEALKSHDVPIVAVSPIVAGAALKGPTAKMMRELNIPTTALAIAEHYKGLADGIMVDRQDAALAPDIEAIGLTVHVTNTVMKTLNDRIELAQAAVHFCGAL